MKKSPLKKYVNMLGTSEDNLMIKPSYFMEDYGDKLFKVRPGVSSKKKLTFNEEIIKK